MKASILGSNIKKFPSFSSPGFIQACNPRCFIDLSTSSKVDTVIHSNHFLKKMLAERTDYINSRPVAFSVQVRHGQIWCSKRLTFLGFHMVKGGRREYEILLLAKLYKT